jgi:hypothetical protein
MFQNEVPWQVLRESGKPTSYTTSGSAKVLCQPHHASSLSPGTFHDICSRTCTVI